MAQTKEDKIKDESEYAYQLSDAEWKKTLSSQEYKVLRKKATEPATTGEYDKFYPKSDKPLYWSKSKYNSGSGWPAFDKCYKGTVDTISKSKGDDTDNGCIVMWIVCFSVV